jgi:hypothetical protein
MNEKPQFTSPLVQVFMASNLVDRSRPGDSRAGEKRNLNLDTMFNLLFFLLHSILSLQLSPELNLLLKECKKESSYK